MRRYATPDQKLRIFVRDGGICVYCKDAAGNQLDHVLPAAHGGPSIDANLVLCCRRCNVDKNNRLDVALIQHAFKHLLDVGESLAWVDAHLAHDTQFPAKSE